jgi:hypothetical protein
MKHFAMLVLSALLLSVTAHGGQSYHEQCWTGTDADKATPVCVKEIKKAYKAQLKREKANVKAFKTDEKMKSDSNAAVKMEAREQKQYTKIEKVQAQFPDLNDQQALVIANHQVFIGMTVDELRASLRLPNLLMATNTTVTADGVEQQEVYGFGYTVTMYVYITNGIVTSYQLKQ